MSSPADQRTSERVAIKSRVKVMSKGRMIAYSLAINLNMGGVLLGAGPALPLGSRCELALFPPEKDGQERILAEGTVVRIDARGTAVQFLGTLGEESYQMLLGQGRMSPVKSVVNAYRDYFRVGQSRDLEDCERLLGVSKRTFRTVFYSTFFTCIPLAVLPVWLFQSSIPPIPAWGKIVSSFAYGAVWLLVIQPTLDVATFSLLRTRKQSGSRA